MKFSDTINYTPDGRITGIERLTKETFTTPSGRSVTEDVRTTITIEDLRAELGDTYVDLENENRQLHANVVAGRDAFERIVKEKAALMQIVAVVREADSRWNDTLAPLLNAPIFQAVVAGQEK